MVRRCAICGERIPADGDPYSCTVHLISTPADRSRAYRDRKRGTPPRTPAPCGTTAAYARHLRRGEPPCQACREANAAKHRELYRRRKA